MRKPDMENAYKNVPCQSKDYPYLGFHGEVNCLFETRQSYGAQSEVSYFDNNFEKLALLS